MRPTTLPSQCGDMPLPAGWDEVWDEVFVARYPDAHGFLAMVTNPDYQKAVVHRQAAVATSRLIRTHPSDTGATFG